MQTIIDAFDEDRSAIISAAQVVAVNKQYPETAIASFSWKTAEIAANSFGSKKIGELLAGSPVPVYAIEYRGKSFAFYCSPVGGSAAATILEEMLAHGSRKFVFYGSCGVLDREIAANSLIVPTAAYRDEGTSYHYAPPGSYIEVQSAERLAEIFSELGLPHTSGRVWTTDAFYRETRRNTERRRAEGCIAVDMECASIMAAAQYRGADCYQVLHAADNLDAQTWDSRTLGTLEPDSRKNYLKIALETAHRISV
ncbi:MAG: nucleoside phosphorylase [Oscillospiraceae bacterium]|jgi:uridine phosphorylase|nr:nucleoside phosphorylase [Oscillospiraceae bacterium]